MASQPLTDATGDDSFGNLRYSKSQKITSSLGRTNYLGNAGAFSGGIHPDPIRRPFVGPMSSRGKVTLSSIVDGTSNTILMGENIGRIKNGKRTHVHSWFVGGLARGRGDAPWNKPPKRPQQMFGTSSYSPGFGFGSMHREGINFAYADCSIEVLNRDIDWQVFYSLCGMADGK